MRMRFLSLTAIAVASLGLAACGGGSSKSSTDTSAKNSQSTAKTSDSKSTLTPIDTCGLVTDAQIAAVGGSGTGKAFERPQTSDTQWDSCTWGELTSGKPVIVIQTVQLKNAPVDALKILLSAGDTAKNPATSVNVGTDGKLYNVALLAGGGGGGVGKTIAFKATDGTRVAVSVTGETVNVPALTTLAEQVAARLQ